MSPRRAGRLSRRELIVGTVGAGSAALIGASPAPAAGADADADAALLTSALRFEQLSVLAYEHILHRSFVTAPAHRLLRTLLTQQRAHARALARELTALGAAVPRPPTRLGDVDHALSAHNLPGHLAGVTTLVDAVALLLNLGSLCEGAYYTAAGKLTAVGPLLTVVRALGSEGQHGTLLTALIHPGDIKRSVPTWYVAGVT